MSKTKSKKLVFYPTETLEHWQHLEQAALDEISAAGWNCGYPNAVMTEHWHSGMLDLDFSSSFLKGTGIFRTERIILFQAWAAFQPVQAASQ